MHKKLCNIFKLKRLKILFLAQSLFYYVFFKFICGQGKRRVNGQIHQLLGGSILGFFDFERKRPNFPLNEQRKSQDYASKTHQWKQSVSRFLNF